ncbi:hypothetical protein U1Q18_012162 [Sarracenia purpurea var. burkii]
MGVLEFEPSLLPLIAIVMGFDHDEEERQCFHRRTAVAHLHSRDLTFLPPLLPHPPSSPPPSPPPPSSVVVSFTLRHRLLHLLYQCLRFIYCYEFELNHLDF